MKKRLDLNFLQTASQTQSFAGWLLLAAGIGMFLEFAVSYVQLHDARSVLLQQMNGTRTHSNVQAQGRYGQFAEKDFEDAEKIFGRLATPWDAFFTGLESIKNSNIAIRSIQPDVQTGILQIEGEAKDYASVLTLVAQLRVTKPFSEVFLLRHEVKRDDPQHPVLFLVSSRWIK